MKRIFFFLPLVLVALLGKAQSCNPVNIMLVTGGHAYDTIQFFQMFDSLNNIIYTHYAQPKANEEIAAGEAENYRDSKVREFFRRDCIGFSDRAK